MIMNDFAHSDFCYSYIGVSIVGMYSSVHISLSANIVLEIELALDAM